jgi:hypothetical protein
LLSAFTGLLSAFHRIPHYRTLPALPGHAFAT